MRPTLPPTGPGPSARGQKKKTGRAKLARPPTSFRRGLLYFTVIFSVLVLTDVAVMGNLVFRDLSDQVVQEAVSQARHEAENIAHALSPVGDTEPVDLYRVVRTTTTFARYIDRILQNYTVHQQIDIVDDKGEVVYTQARRADMERKERAARARRSPVLQEIPGMPRPYRSAEERFQARAGSGPQAGPTAGQQAPRGGREIGQTSPVRLPQGPPPSGPPPEPLQSLIPPDFVGPAVPAPPSASELQGGDMEPSETIIARGGILNQGPSSIDQAELPPRVPASERLLERMGIPVPAVALGPSGPGDLDRVRQSRSVMNVTVPVQLGAGREGFVKVSLSEDELNREIEALRNDLMLKILIGAGISLILIGVAYVFVVKLFNKTRRLETEAQMADRLAYVGTLAAGLAHEIRNPLSAMKLNLQLLESSVQSPGGSEDMDAEVPELLRETQVEVDRLGDLVTSFLSYARPPRLEKKPTDLNRLVEETVHFLQADAEQRQVTTELNLDNRLPRLALDGKQIRQAILNIIRNGIMALEEMGGGTLRLTTAPAPGGGRGAYLTIEDDGPGIPAARLPHIFQVFYSSRPGGSGLGLSIAKRVVDGHGGTIEVESAEGSGTRFTINFPPAPAEPTVKAAL